MRLELTHIIGNRYTFETEGGTEIVLFAKNISEAVRKLQVLGMQMTKPLIIDQRAGNSRS